jgi:hypothetical protein
MGAREVASRALQFTLQRRDALLRCLGIAPLASRIKPAKQIGKFFLSPEEIRAVAEIVTGECSGIATRIISQADAVCRHQFGLLGFSEIDFGKTIDWHLDAVHGKHAPIIPWHSIRIFDFDVVGDPKVTWELNRHQHFVTLAKAFLISKNERYLRELSAQYRSWIIANPYPLGINWASSLEVGFRLLSWVWVRYLLKAMKVEDLDADLLRGISLHGSHIRRYLSTYTSPNTHLLGEAVALFVAGTTCREIEDASEWREMGWRIVLEESSRQVRADGFHFEQSSYYHVYALDFFLHARILAAKNGITIPDTFDEVLIRMLSALNRIAGDGTVPRLGDDDGGRVFDGSRNQAEHLTDPLAIGSLIYPSAGLRIPGSEITEETLWLLGPDSLARFAELPAAGVEANPLENSGICVIRSGAHRITFDAAPQGSGNAGHGHSDSLSITASSNGYEWLIDPGTYSYSAIERRRDLLRGTNAHNTIEIDERSQSEASGPFSWRVIPDVQLDYRRAGKGFYAICGGHDGYERLQDPVTHKRWVMMAEDILLVRDKFDSRGRHSFRSSWHLDRGCVVEKLSSESCMISHAKAGRILFTAVSDEGWRMDFTDSWQSPAYGIKVATQCVEFRADKEAPCETAIALVLGATRANPAVDAATLLHLGKNHEGLHHYRLQQTMDSHDFIFNDRSGSQWESGPIKSDARLLHIRYSEKNEVDVIHLCDATYLQIDGRALFASATKVEITELAMHRSQPATL